MNRMAIRIAQVFGSVALAVVAATGAASAQGKGVPNAMQGFSQNRDQPIQIEAASLEMRDKKKEATFSGNVKVVQGDTTMTSKTLVVFYESSSGQAATPAPSAKPAASEVTIASSGENGSGTWTSGPPNPGQSRIRRRGWSSSTTRSRHTRRRSSVRSAAVQR